MIKAIFLDYTGTMIREDSPAAMELLKRCTKGSNIGSPEVMLKYWWTGLKALEEECFLEKYLTEDEIVDRLLEKCRQELGLQENFEELHALCRHFWVYAPLFSDTKEFFETCSLPIYIISNNGAEYVERSMQYNGLHPAGIVCGDMARAYKPHRELFIKALEISGLKPDEVVHIGDSVASDVAGARAAGIRPILLDRNGQTQCDGVTVVHSLTEALTVLKVDRL